MSTMAKTTPLLAVHPWENHQNLLVNQWYSKYLQSLKAIPFKKFICSVKKSQ